MRTLNCFLNFLINRNYVFKILACVIWINFWNLFVYECLWRQNWQLHIVFTVAQWGTVQSNFNIYYVFLQFAPCQNCLCNCVVKWFLNYSNQLLKLTPRDGALLNLNCHEIETEARQTFKISSLSSFRIHFAATTDVEPLQNSVKTSKMVFFLRSR